MNTKNILVSFLLIASVLLLTATVSAANFSISGVKLDNVDYANTELTAGESVTVKLQLTSDIDAKDVVVKVELGSETAEKTVGVLRNATAKEVVLTIEVPSDFKKDSLDKTMDFEITVEGEEIESGDDLELGTPFNEEVQVLRPSYEVAIKSITASNIVEAGETMSVNVVLRNTGYNDVEDVFVTISVPELGITKSVYFGDIVNAEYEAENPEDDDATDTVVGTISLNVPYSAKSGVYTLQVDAETDDSKNTATREITINNGVSDVAIKSGNDLVLLNPTNKLVVYTVKYLANEEVVVIPAASSKTVTIESSNSDFDVTVYNGETLLSTVKFTGASETTELTSPVFVLTVILAIVFLVLLVVLVVLLTKKPAKAEEFGESYY
ncbi:MAG: hypothetical protein WC511_00155 [Candidatus Pacearchaeota archaeon]